MGVPMSVLSLPRLECDQDRKLVLNLDYEPEYRSDQDDFIDENQTNAVSSFDKLYVYPIFATDLRVQQKLLNKKSVRPLKPIILYGQYPEKQPLVIDLNTVMRNLDSVGELEKNAYLLSSLLVAQYIENEFTVNYSYGFSNITGKYYFYKQGNFDELLSKVSNGQNLWKSNTSSRKVFVSYLHKLMNKLTGSVWLNGFCISGPENPRDRIQVESVRIRSIPARVTIWVQDLSGIHCIRTKTRLEIYGKARDDITKAIFFRGEFANSLIVTEIEDNLMSILIPAYSPLTSHEDIVSHEH